MIDLTALERAYSAARRKQRFSGVVYLSDLKTGEVLLSKVSGLAYRSEVIHNRAGTKFPVASGSKIFTALAVLRLVEEGRISLDMPVVEVLGDDFPGDRGITVKHLMTHTSGLADYFEEEQAESILDYARLWNQIPVYLLETDRDFLPLFRGKRANFKPGERFSYCNAGFLVLGMLVAQVAGIPFRKFVSEQVFQPAGMKDAGYFYADRLPAGCALGFVASPDGEWRSNTFMVPYVGGGDGGAYVSAPDWGRFWQALMDGRLLGPRLLEQMLEPQVATGSGEGRFYGLGVWITDRKGERSYAVFGQDPGVEMTSSCFPSRNLHLAVMSNHDEGAGKMIKSLRVVNDKGDC